MWFQARQVNLIGSGLDALPELPPKRRDPRLPARASEPAAWPIIASWDLGRAEHAARIGTRPATARCPHSHRELPQPSLNERRPTYSSAEFFIALFRWFAANSLAALSIASVADIVGVQPSRFRAELLIPYEKS